MTMYKKIRKVKKDEEATVNTVRIVIFNAWAKCSP